MTQENIDWAEYGRINQGELAIALSLLQEADAVYAIVAFKNISKRSINLFTFNIKSRFKVYLDGSELQYNGPMASIAPSKRWYSELKPGDVFEEKVNLSEHYSVSSQLKGKLKVLLHNPGSGDVNQEASIEQDL